MAFQPCKIDPEIQMRRVDNEEDLSYECIAICTDDFIIASKSPEIIVDSLISECNFKLKGTGPINCHLGCDFI